MTIRVNPHVSLVPQSPNNAVKTWSGGGIDSLVGAAASKDVGEGAAVDASTGAGA